MTLEEIVSKEEKQVFDRKSADIDAKALARTIVAFANADGGDIAIGISDKTRRIDGTAALMDAYVVLQDHINDYMSII